MTHRTDVRLESSWDSHVCIRPVRSADLTCLCVLPQEVLGFLTSAARSGGWRMEDGSACNLANVRWLFVGCAGALGPLAESGGFLQLAMPEVIPGNCSASLFGELSLSCHFCTYRQ